MAPLALPTFSSLSSHLSLNKRSAMPSNTAPLTPRANPTTQYDPGHGVVSPFDINNTFMFVLFGILGAVLVCASIWFFFWAKNGSFRFRKRDWDDYKSTVLRRKGPNGTILTGATPSTVLGGGSVVGSKGSTSDWGNEKDVEKAQNGKAGKGKKNRFRRKKNHNDDDVRAYRSEKPAKVGGLNREADGSYHDYTNTDMSEVSGSRPRGSSHHGHNHGRSGIRGGGPGTKREPKGRQMSYTAGTEATFSVASDDSHRPLTQSSPFNNRHSNTSSPRHSRQPSPTKRSSGVQQPGNSRYSARMSGGPGSYAEPLDFESRYEGSQSGTEQSRNTKAYFHPIPGLNTKSTAGGGGGYRRGGGGRRDSLSDSDGEGRRY